MCQRENQENLKLKFDQDWNATIKTLWDLSQQRGKFMTLIIYIRREKKFHINNISYDQEMVQRGK